MKTPSDYIIHESQDEFILTDGRRVPKQMLPKSARYAKGEPGIVQHNVDMLLSSNCSRALGKESTGGNAGQYGFALPVKVDPSNGKLIALVNDPDSDGYQPGPEVCFHFYVAFKQPVQFIDRIIFESPFVPGVDSVLGRLNIIEAAYRANKVRAEKDRG